MALADVWSFLEGLPSSQAIASGVLFPWIESIHVLALVVVVGAIAMVDLRLLGFRAHERGVRHLIREVLPYTWVGFGFALVSGFLLFASSASTYAENIAFRFKLCLLLLAGANMLYFHLLPYRSVHLWDELIHPPLRARIAGGVSLCCWIGVVAFGRWIGFIQ
jgi:hypothetical protein